MDSQNKTSDGAAAPVPGVDASASQSSVVPATGVTDIQEAVSSPVATAHVQQVMGEVPANGSLQSAPPAPAPTDPPVASSDLKTPLIADDNDLIEPEWVDSAKAIVERTHDDPYAQNKEIGKLKADYMMKRYKKTIKVTEE